VRAHPNAKAISNWVMGDILRVVKEGKLDEALVIREWPVAPERLAAMVRLIDAGQISGKIAKTVFEEMVKSGADPAQIVMEQGLIQVSDDGPILAQSTPSWKPTPGRWPITVAARTSSSLFRRPGDEGDARQGQPAEGQRTAEGETCWLVSLAHAHPPLWLTWRRGDGRGANSCSEGRCPSHHAFAA